MKRILSLWRGLSSRERVLTGAGSVALISVVLYVTVIEPHYQKFNVLQQQVPDKRLAYATMQQQIAAIKPLLARRDRGSQPVTDGLTLMTRVEKSAERSDLKSYIKRIQPGKEGEITIWISDVYFNPWITWLDSLLSTGIQIVSVKVQRAENNTTNIQLTLR